MFVQGLLTLLPAPVRGTITFATNVIDPLRANAQIKFLAAPNQRPARHLIFDWATGKLVNDPPDDIYATFATSQFRFDPVSAVENVRKLERTAAWRISRKDDLTSALAWAARRASLDSAIASGQPADPKMVGEVIADDQSLTDELRVSYARHLLRFALSLDDPAQTDAVGLASTRSNAVATAITVDLQTIVSNPARAQAVQRVIARWTGHVPNFDLNDPRWVALLSAAILVRAKPILEAGNPKAIRELLESYLEIPPTLRIERAMVQVIGAARKTAYTDPGVARALILNSAAFLPTNGLQRIFIDPGLIGQMPPSLREALGLLLPNSPLRDSSGSAVSTPIAGLLIRAADSCGENYRAILLARLTELALAARRTDLIDADVLKGLLESGNLLRTTRFDVLCQQIVEDFSKLNVLNDLDTRSLSYLVGLSLVRERYPQAAAQLEFYQNTLYKGQTAESFNQLITQVFRETPLSPAQVQAAFDAMQPYDLRPLSRAYALFGVLDQHNWDATIGFASRDLTNLLTADPTLISAIDMPQALKLVQANADQHDAVQTLRLATALTNRAIGAGQAGLPWVNQIYEASNWGPEMSASAIELLCNYVRHAPDPQAKALIDRSPQQYGLGITNALNAVYRLRSFTAGVDLATFAAQVTSAAALLTDILVVYHESQTAPTLQSLRRIIDSLAGNLGEAERQQLASTLSRLSEQCTRLAAARTRDSAQMSRLSQAAIPPTNGLDLLRWIGGYCSKGRIIPLDLARAAPPVLFGTRSLNTLYRDTVDLSRLLDQMASTFPAGVPALENTALQAEFEALIKQVTTPMQRPTIVKLAEVTQTLTDLITLLGDQRPSSGPMTDTKMRTAPKVASEALAWTAAYLHSGKATI